MYTVDNPYAITNGNLILQVAGRKFSRKGNLDQALEDLKPTLAEIAQPGDTILVCTAELLPWLRLRGLTQEVEVNLACGKHTAWLAPVYAAAHHGNPIPCRECNLSST